MGKTRLIAIMAVSGLVASAVLLSIVNRGAPAQEVKIVVMFRLPVAPGREAELEQRFLNRSRLIDKMEGFLGMQVLKNRQVPGDYVVVSRWASLSQFEAWTKSDAFKMAHGTVPADPGLISGSPRLEIYQVVAE